MTRPAIIVENLSKRYRIGTSGGPAYHRLSEALTGVPNALFNTGRRLFSNSPLLASGGVAGMQQSSFPLPASRRGAGGEGSASPTDFWALNDVSFEIQPGEVVGIIGRNGAGKSTLLKVLSRITEPTSGRFGIRGRVASLLEVGTGFHPELTGRENIYVSGITLGMTRDEVKRSFEEIVDFSGVEKFLDTPVKRYSSGMQVRLGFAVAAHLQSEILIIDEVLAVGDAEFQRKCLHKMGDLASYGRTVVLVSHSTGTVKGLASRGIVLDRGRVLFNGDCRSAINCYQSNLTEIKTDNSDFLKSVWIVDPENNSETDLISLAAPLQLRLIFRRPIDDPQLSIGIGFNDSSGRRVLSINSRQNSQKLTVEGAECLDCTLPSLPLKPGRYLVSIVLAATRSVDLETVAVAATFEVLNTPIGRDHVAYHAGDCVVQSIWKVNHYQKTQAFQN